MAMTPTTELDAVNQMLVSIGEAPVNVLGSGLQEAEIAQTTLTNISRDVQSQGWYFNTEIRYTLPRNSDNEIVLPNNCVKVDRTQVYRDYDTDVVERNRKLYDRVTNSYTFDKDLVVNMVVLLDFNELPEVARRYITLKAARVFQDQTVGAQELHGYQINDEQFAYLALREAESESMDYNVFDNYDTYRVLDRTINNTVINELTTS
tara:strand:- start:585 stop:1202 length:618 start_codon:yes stop_codon:yes gene_type:complete